MLKYLGQTDQSHLTIGSCHFNHPPAEGFSQRMGGKVVEVEAVLALDQFEVSVHGLNGVNAASPTDETGLRKIDNFESVFTVFDMPLEAFIDTNFPPFASFLFKHYHLFFGEQLPPSQAR